MGDSNNKTDAFIARWAGVSGSERANYQLFIADLCALLELPAPDPAQEDTRDNAYVFERRVTFAHGDGSESRGFIDCYRRGAFVLEAKKVKAGIGAQGFDDALMRARAQAEGYARALPAAEGRPPFVLVVDVGHVIELYAEFTRSGATYTPFPDARSHRLQLADLRSPALRERLRTLWLDPMALDPARASAKVTRDVAAQLANLARALEAAGHPAEAVAAFLTRCLFCMFAEDVELLPKGADGQGAFKALLLLHRNDPETLRQMLRVLWTDMDRGGFSAVLAGRLLRFNGKLFKGWSAADYVLPLTRELIDGLLLAAVSNWREVEPAIFGTLLERALSPDERHALGAHYTPRAYVERLVLPTVVEPLRADWADAQAAALLLATEASALEGKKREEKLAEARAEIRRFHHRLCSTRVLDPACGSGNFLYVTLEHLKRLESEVLNQLEALGDTQGRLGFAGETVTPQQLLGIEINERAAALAELVLWIGYLQWHIRSFGNASVAEPVIHDYGNIEHRDAVLAYDGQEPMRDAEGQLVQRWDGKTFKVHPVTGERVPDETALVPQWRYLNPRAAEWPKADFIVGNPPFIGNKRMRDALGDGYVEALRNAWPGVPSSADFVMYWWKKAAHQTQGGSSRSAGLITTNSITQTLNRSVVESALAIGMRIVFAIPDHPWVDGNSGAQVRVAMSVQDFDTAKRIGCSLTSMKETAATDGAFDIIFQPRVGVVRADLSVGTDVSSLTRLQACKGLACPGVQLSGQGFILSAEDSISFRSGNSKRLIKRYITGRDLTQQMREQYVIDTFGLGETELRVQYPDAYQHLVNEVRPSREAKRGRTKDSIEYADRWWLFSKPRPKFRKALFGLDRFVVTSRTARHRAFEFIDSATLPETKVLIVAFADAYHLGVLHSDLHVAFANRVGGWLGVGNDSTYNHSECFETFPFPADDTGLTPELHSRIRSLAEQLDAHRKAQQAAYPELTLTGMYNVLEKLRSGEALNAKDKLIHAQGLVSVLKSLHDDLDAAVLQAYAWHDLQTTLTDRTKPEARAAAVETLLERLVALNAKRAAEEAAGTIRWLRPEFQAPAAGVQQAMPAEVDDEAEPTAPAPAVPKRAWPAGLPEQIKAVAEVLAASPRPLALADLEQRFTARGRWRDRLPTIVDTLEALGRARRSGDASTGLRWQGL